MRIKTNQKNILQTEVNNLIASLSKVHDVVIAREYANFIKQEISNNARMAMLAHGKQKNSLTLNILQ